MVNVLLNENILFVENDVLVKTASILHQLGNLWIYNQTSSPKGRMILRKRVPIYFQHMVNSFSTVLKQIIHHNIGTTALWIIMIRAH